LDDIKEESASDSDEDDFEKWRTVRNKLVEYCLLFVR